MLDWIHDHTTLLAWLGGASIVTLLGSLVALPVLLARMPADYFVTDEPPPDSWRGHHPVLRIAILIVKNAFGGVLLLAGLAMLVLPGQGLLTILIGLMLVDFPGKRRLEIQIVRRRPIHRAIDWIRRRAHQPPLQLPD
jgi:hypothetical protein